MDRTHRRKPGEFGSDALVPGGLVISLVVIVQSELSRGAVGRRVSDQNHSVESGLLDAADKLLLQHPDLLLEVFDDVLLWSIQ
jgi:hypothetical protein